MSDPAQLADINEDEGVAALPALPPSPEPVAAAQHHHVHMSPPSSPPSSYPAAAARTVRKRSHSSSSHVDIDHFDPEGVHDLRRSLSRVDAGLGNASESTLAVPNSGPFDFEKTLRNVMKKRETHGIPNRELGVTFRELRVIGLGAAASYQTTFGSVFDPKNITDLFRKSRNPPLRDILYGFEGSVRPGEMLLVLGSPGSGCSTLLKVLANQRAEYHQVDGDVKYDAFTPDDVRNHYRGDVVYCPEDDVHFPTLTVDETLRFAAKMRAPHTRFDNATRSDFITSITGILETVFGLRHVKKTPVGDAAIRGVSGGEKKRVSISEALALRSLITSWDNSTRGLDASTALEFVRALRIGTDIGRLSTIVSIYQAGESLYKLFDKVCIIYEGRMAYFGRADEARQYFIDMGYEPAYRQTTADFLVAVTDPNGRIVREGFEQRVARTPAEFAERFLASPEGTANRDEMAEYNQRGDPAERRKSYRQSVIMEHASTQSKKSPYTISIFMQARAVALRRIQIIKGNLATEIIQMMTFVLQAIINGTVFYNLKESTSEYFSRGGVLFFALLFAALSSMAEIPALFGQRPIVIRHAKAAMYHPFIEATALTVVDIPITFITIMIFSVVLYLLVHLQRTASQFFIFFVFVFVMALTMKAWFRAVAAALGAPAPAQTVAGILLLGLVLYTGYTIPRPSMIGALRWITYVNPLRYGFEGIMTNEFHTLNGTCANLAPHGPGYEGIQLVNQACTTVGSLPGQSTVDGNRFVELSYDYSYSHLWRNFGIIIAFGIGFVAILLLFTEYNMKVAGESSVTLFKRGSTAYVLKEAEEKADSSKPGSIDEEKGRAPSRGTAAGSGSDGKEEEAALADAPAMKDVFTWQHLQYDVPVGGGEHRRLLDDVTGFVAPGKLTALMGESGAGKTTLLNVLAQRTTTGVVHGERLVNGHALPADFQAQTGYCQQMDTHLAESTVRESLLFSARLRQPPSVPDAEKEAYVDQCLKMCGLEAYADAIVGSLGVEHRKRTTIGVELAAKPRLLLFLDEPTSGLDSQSAWAIVSFLRKLADHGQAILCTIHQPSAELFHSFDRLLLLRKGGQTVYFGDIGKNSQTLLNYFHSKGGYECPPDANPAEYILDVIGAGATATTSIDWHDAWSHSEEAGRVQKELEQVLEDGRRNNAVDIERHSEFSTNWAFQLKELWLREMTRHWRDPTYLVAKLMLNITGALFIGFTFFKAKSSIQGTQNKIFAVFMSTILSAPLSNQIQVPFIITRRVYEIRERPSRMYSWTAFVTAQFLAELPLNIIGSSVYFLIWFWLVSFPGSRAGFTYLALGIAYPFYYTSLAQAVAAMSPNPEIAALLFSFLFSFVITFNGVLQPYVHLGWWQWMYRLSPYTYLVEGLVGQAVGNSQVVCSAIELITIIPPSGQTCGQYLGTYMQNFGGYVVDASATASCQFCTISSTNTFLQQNFNIFYSHHWRNYGLIWVYVIFNICSIYGLTYIFRIKGVGGLISSARGLFARK
ncbi:hypothetical protein FA95DRAFT_1631947 [Auriscalpium vulgare]|uniref:Uncharacterized protein n=1 Tax=Auriscalpium vulgare TaxID=40419 RepID=A0ACB8RGL4_9AGAM|nr:hypothetical protein FA95DRAFT_1631947 [Auriscalpium vulgare]